MKKISIDGTLLALTYGDNEVYMKLAYIWTAFLMVLSFKVHADQTSAKTEDELPIVQFENKNEIKLEDEAQKKKKKQLPGQMVMSDQASDMQVTLLMAKKAKAKTSEKVDEDDFGRLDRELEVLK